MDELISGRPEYEIRLYTLSLITTSSSFWERQEIQTEVQNYFIKNCNYEWKPKEWHKITQKVLNIADSCGLVATILLDLNDAIVNTGIKILEWIMYVRWGLGLGIIHALPILWTPLGFVDEVKIFKSIWVKDPSLYFGSPDKPIFRIACMLAQEDFVREHESEMIEELKKLPMEANLNNVDLEAVNYPDKVYGIISTYVCYLVNRDSENKAYYYYAASNYNRSKREFEPMLAVQLDMVDRWGQLLREDMEKAINEGLILPPEIMAKLCGCPGLFHGVKYYMNKLNGDQKKEVNDWLLIYFRGKSHVSEYTHDCRSRNFWEISALVAEHLKSLDGIRFISDNLLFIFLNACPLESVLWPIVRNLLNNVETTREQLDEFFGMTLYLMRMDHDSGIPNTRYFYQKLVKKICATFDRRKMGNELKLMSDIESCCCYVRDFTMVRTEAYDKLTKFRGYAEHSLQNLFFRLGFDDSAPNLEIFEIFFDQMFDCPDDRILFVLKVFHESPLLLECDFDMWEKLYSILDMPAPLRDSIDPVKCLSSLACDLSLNASGISNIEKCEQFIKWWHKSNDEDQKNLKEKFKESPYLSECIYKLFNLMVDWAQKKRFRLLQWLFDSEYEISKFKKEKLSILDLLDNGLTLSNVHFERNRMCEGIDEFVIFSEASAESVANAKDEIRSKIEELISKYLTVFNIGTFNFLINWVSTSEDAKKKMFENLMKSSKILELCEDVLSIYVSGNHLDVFFNEWVLKYCEDISQLKCSLLSEYKGLRSESYMAELSSVFERLERGESSENVRNIIYLMSL